MAMGWGLNLDDLTDRTVPITLATLTEDFLVFPAVLKWMQGLQPTWLPQSVKAINLCYRATLGSNPRHTSNGRSLPIPTRTYCRLWRKYLARPGQGCQTRARNTTRKGKSQIPKRKRIIRLFIGLQLVFESTDQSENWKELSAAGTLTFNYEVEWSMAINLLNF